MRLVVEVVFVFVREVEVVGKEELEEASHH